MTFHVRIGRCRYRLTRRFPCILLMLIGLIGLWNIPTRSFLPPLPGYVEVSFRFHLPDQTTGRAINRTDYTLYDPILVWNHRVPVVKSGFVVGWRLVERWSELTADVVYHGIEEIRDRDGQVTGWGPATPTP